MPADSAVAAGAHAQYNQLKHIAQMADLANARAIHRGYAVEANHLQLQLVDHRHYHLFRLHPHSQATDRMMHVNTEPYHPSYWRWVRQIRALVSCYCSTQQLVMMRLLRLPLLHDDSLGLGLAALEVFECMGSRGIEQPDQYCTSFAVCNGEVLRGQH